MIHDAAYFRECSMLAINVMRLCRAIRNSPTYCKIKGASQIESSVLYRSNQLLELHAYIKSEYWPTKLGDFNELYSRDELNAKVMVSSEELSKISNDEDILGLYCQILSKRLFIIDDKEFKGTRQTLMGKFLSLDQIKFAAFTLNRIAF